MKAGAPLKGIPLLYFRQLIRVYILLEWWRHLTVVIGHYNSSGILAWHEGVGQTGRM